MDSLGNLLYENSFLYLNKIILVTKMFTLYKQSFKGDTVNRQLDSRPQLILSFTCIKRTYKYSSELFIELYIQPHFGCLHSNKLTKWSRYVVLKFVSVSLKCSLEYIYAKKEAILKKKCNLNFLFSKIYYQVRPKRQKLCLFTLSWKLQ